MRLNAVFKTAAAAFACGVFMQAPAARADLTKVQTFNIAAQALSDALIQFSKQADVQVVGSTQTFENLKSAGISGSFTGREALQKLLTSQPVIFEEVTTRSVRILPQNPPPAFDAARPALISGSSSAGNTRLTHTASVDSSGDQVAQAGASQENSDAAGTRVEEVVVTAQRRAERLQDVPISISVLGGEQLDRFAGQSVSEALRQVPGVFADPFGGGTRTGNSAGTVVIRGVAPLAGAGTTAYYLDSVPFGFVRRSSAPDANPFDLQRVEVLRGPQGTLYGSSALNGVVRVLTKDPDLDSFEVKGRAATASTEHGSETYKADAAVNVPLIEGKLAARAVVGYQDLGGWIDKPIEKDANHSKIATYRMKLAAKPVEELSIIASAWISRSTVGAPSNTANGRTKASLVKEETAIDYEVYGLSADYDFGAFTLSSATSHIDFRNPGRFDYEPLFPGNTLHFEFDSKVFAEELTLKSATSGPLQWSIGGIYRNATDKNFSLRTNSATGAPVATYLAPTLEQYESESFAVFGEATYALIEDRLELTAGLRYFEDRVLDRELSRRNVVGGVPPNGLFRDENKFTKVSPRAILAWHPNNDATLYASYGEGFRSGLTQAFQTAEQFPNYPSGDPDNLKNYEIGAKGSVLDGRISFDSALYYIDWQGVQQALQVFVAPTVIQPAFVNGGSASGIGLDLGLSLRPIDGLTLSAGYSWNQLEFDNDVFSGSTLLYAQGSRPASSPRYTMSGSADYVFSLGGEYNGRLSLSATHRPRIFLEDGGPGFIVAFSEPTTLLNASVGIDTPRNWSFSLYAYNLGNEQGLSRDAFRAAWDTYVRPRTIGLQLEYQFGGR